MRESNIRLKEDWPDVIKKDQGSCLNYISAAIFLMISTELVFAIFADD